MHTDASIVRVHVPEMQAANVSQVAPGIVPRNDRPRTTQTRIGGRSPQERWNMRRRR
jgi:hypothetical protein